MYETYEFDDELNPDRRRKDRKAVHVRGWVDPGGVAAPKDCMILDLTDDGARVAVKDAATPDTFTLHDDAKNNFGQATVVWRKATSVGVRLERGENESVPTNARALMANAPTVPDPRMKARR